MSFKVGDKVKIVKIDSISAIDKKDLGKQGVIIEKGVNNDHPYRVEFKNKETNIFNDDEMKKIGRGRPKKEKLVKYIAIYNETDGDPAKKFFTLKELKTWIKEAKENENIIFDSIEVYPVSERLEVELKTSVSLKVKK